MERSKHDDFVDILAKQFLNKLVNVRVLGDWMFTGILAGLRSKETIDLNDVTVTSCQGLTICSFDVDRVSIQVKDITSIGDPAA